MILLELFFEFFKIGLFTFGGGYAMIPLLKEVVINKGWIEESLFYDFIGICESTPGPIAINMATFVGSSQYGFLGSLASTLGVVLPSFIIILLIAIVLKSFIQNKHFQRALKGIKAVVLGLILSTGLLLTIGCFGYESINSFNVDYPSIIIFSALVIIYFVVKYVFKKKMNVISLILTSSALGILVCLLFN